MTRAAKHLASAITLLALISCGEFHVTVDACTVFLASDGVNVLAGNNEDVGYLPAWIAFLPSEPAKYGRVVLGIEGVPQGGMNDQGLLFDCLTVDQDWAFPRLFRALPKGVFTLEILETCSDVDDVIEYLRSHQFPGPHRYQYFFGDRHGNAIVFEGNEIVHKRGAHHIAVNVRQSEEVDMDRRSQRFATATAMLSAPDTITQDLVRDTLAAVHFEDSGGFATLYSTAYDLVHRTITIYFYGDFENPVQLQLDEELETGPRVVPLAELFPPRPGYTAWEMAEYEAFGRKLSSRGGGPVAPERLDEFTGHYRLVAFSLPLLYHPVTITELSIVRKGDRLHLIGGEQGTSFELFSASYADLIHVNVSRNPYELRLNFVRTPIFGLPRLKIEVVGVATWTFRRVDEEPRFDTLFNTSLPLPDHAGS